MSFTQDLKYPFREEEWHKTMGIGMVLEYFTWLIAPAILLAGYYVKVMRHTANGVDEPPTFDNLSSLFSDGIGAFVIIFCYFVIPSIVSWMIFIPSLISLVEGNTSGLQGILFGMFVSTSLYLLFGYGGVAGLVKFSETGKIRSGFSPSLVSIIFSAAWIKAWLKVSVVSMLALFAALIIAIIPFVNFAHIILIPFAVKYFSTVYSRVFSHAYYSAQ